MVLVALAASKPFALSPVPLIRFFALAVACVTGRRRAGLVRQPLEVAGAGKSGAALEGAQALGAHGGGQRADAHVVGVEWVVGRAQMQGPALIEKDQGAA